MKIISDKFPICIGKKGWPWDNTSINILGDQSNYPKISIITPSFNQGDFIEATIRSILLQNYANLEYIIIDGGSTDQTMQIIDKYKDWIDIIISEKDNGQSDAINKGWLLATGQITTWINSDDYLAPNCLNEIAKLSQLSTNTNTNTIFAGNVINFNDYKNTTFKFLQRNISFENVIRFWDNKCNWHQPGLFFPMKLIKEKNFLNTKFHYSMDFDLLCKILPDSKVIYSDKDFTFFRLHDLSKGVSSPQKTINEKVFIAIQYWNQLEKPITLKDKFKFYIWLFKYLSKSILYFNFNFKLKNIITLISKWN